MISIIIPTINEAENLQRLLQFFKENPKHIEEIILVDGGSTDQTLAIAEQNNIRIFRVDNAFRAKQMNIGAENAKGEILYFIHADVILRPEFANDILQGIEEGYPAGCYRYQFNSPRRLLRSNAYFTRFAGIMCRGGDQTLYIKKEVFQDLGGFDEYYVIMEDYDIIIRLRKRFRFKIIQKDILVSARKYEKNAWARVQAANFIVFMAFFAKVPPQKLKKMYKKMLN